MGKEPDSDEKMLEEFIQNLNLKHPRESYDPHRYQTTNSREDVKTVFSNLKEEKIQSLKEAIEDIESLIVRRETLHKEMMKDLGKIESEVNAIITSMSPNPNLRDAPEVMKVREELRREIVAVRQMGVKEKLDCFRDIADLKKELRERVHDFRERETQNEAFDNIIEP